MDGYEKIAYALLGIIAIAWLIAMVLGMVLAFPLGLIALLAFLAVGVLFIKVLKERWQSRDDNYYSKHVEK